MRNDNHNRMTDSELEALVSKLAPKNAGLDQNFKQDLNYRLHSEISQMKMRDANKTTINFNFMNKFKYVLTAATAVAIVALIFVTLPKDKNSVLLPGKQQITKLNENAFGSLATLTVAGARGMGGGGGGGGMGGDATSAVAPDSSKVAAPAVGMGGGGGGDAMIYQPYNYKFVYKGEDFTIDTDKMPVYERQKGFGASVSLESFLSNFNVGSFNIGKFSSARMDYLTASQDVDKGYTLSMDFREGNVYIGQNWERWPNLYATCSSPECYEQNRIKVDQLPSNEEALNIASQFLDEYGIDKSAFGAPYVQDSWRVDYERAADKSTFYIPEGITVIYPTKIEGNEIYDQGGNKTGMYITVDARNKKVSSVGDLNGQRYQASDYGTEKDAKRILAVAEKGGYQNYYPMMEQAGVKTEVVELGNPTSGYVRLWQIVNNQSKDLFVPSLIFPITNSPTNYYSKNIIVPIIKDVLDSQQNTPPIGVMKGGVAQ